MNGLKSMLLAEQFKLEQIIQTIKVRLSNAPEGSLRLSKSKNYTQYYYSTKENKKGKYIAKGNKDLIQKLAQKSYDEKVLRLAEKKLLQIKKLTDDYEDDEIEKVYF